jgi:hypothetical protein
MERFVYENVPCHFMCVLSSLINKSTTNSDKILLSLQHECFIFSDSTILFPIFFGLTKLTFGTSLMCCAYSSKHRHYSCDRRKHLHPSCHTPTVGAPSHLAHATHFSCLGTIVAQPILNHPPSILLLQKKMPYGHAVSLSLIAQSVSCAHTRYESLTFS